MDPDFDMFEYLDWLRRAWRIPIAACSAAFLLSLSLSLLLPKRYTATASLVIEPPGGSEARLSTAVSPIYLESLKTYERFAGSDSLFSRAAEQFHLTGASGSPPIEALKRRVLRVSKVKDTKLLEISVTLGSPTLAQRVAQYLAEQAVAASRAESLAADAEFTEQARKQAAEAKLRLDAEERRWNELASAAPVESLQSEIDADVELRSKLQEQLVEAQSNAAAYLQQTDSATGFAHDEVLAERARAALLEQRSQALDQTIEAKARQLAGRGVLREASQRDLQAAETSYQAASNRLREYEAAMGTHAEQVRIVDPGIVPGQPVSPRVLLNVGAAVFLALMASLVYVSFAFVYSRRPIAFERSTVRGMRV